MSCPIRHQWRRINCDPGCPSHLTTKWPELQPLPHYHRSPLPHSRHRMSLTHFQSPPPLSHQKKNAAVCDCGMTAEDHSSLTTNLQSTSKNWRTSSSRTHAVFDVITKISKWSHSNTYKHEEFWGESQVFLCILALQRLFFYKITPILLEIISVCLWDVSWNLGNDMMCVSKWAKK